MFWGNTEWGNENVYDDKYAVSFRRGAKDASPCFKVKKYFPIKEELADTNKVSGTFKGVLYNEPKVITKHDGWTADIPASFTIVLDEEKEGVSSVCYVSIDYNAWSQMRATLNSILSANVGDKVELYTKTTVSKSNGKTYKVINVTNPEVKKEIKYTDRKTGEDKTAMVNESYAWAIPTADIPVIEVMKDGDEILKVKDEEANAFFKAKIAEKFNKATESNGGGDDVFTDIDNPF